MKEISLRVPAKLFRQMEEAKAAFGIDKSEIIRCSLRWYYRQHGNFNVEVSKKEKSSTDDQIMKPNIEDWMNATSEQIREIIRLRLAKQKNETT